MPDKSKPDPTPNDVTNPVLELVVLDDVLLVVLDVVAISSYPLINVFIHLHRLSAVLFKSLCDCQHLEVKKYKVADASMGWRHTLPKNGIGADPI
ncbi:hypothetical protein ACLEE2_05030 [Lonsdalea quercina]